LIAAVKHKASTTGAACVGPGTHCTRGLVRTLTGSVTFWLVQQGDCNKLRWHVTEFLTKACGTQAPQASPCDLHHRGFCCLGGGKQLGGLAGPVGSKGGTRQPTDNPEGQRAQWRGSHGGSQHCESSFFVNLHLIWFDFSHSLTSLFHCMGRVQARGEENLFAAPFAMASGPAQMLDSPFFGGQNHPACRPVWAQWPKLSRAVTPPNPPLSRLFLIQWVGVGH